MERKLNKLLSWMFIYNALIYAISVAFGTTWIYKYVPDGVWYLGESSNPNDLAWKQSMTYYILYTYTIPISLFISLEIVRIIQAIIVTTDPEMKFTLPTGNQVSAQVRNSNLNEDLGKIQHIFSDKTGTLTQNVMKLSYWYSAGQLFNEAENPGDLGRAIKVRYNTYLLDHYNIT